MHQVELARARAFAAGWPEGIRRERMVAKIKSEMSVGLTPEIQEALQIATEFQGMKPSQAILERLVREGFLKHPMHKHFENCEPAK